jgi:hypothetical protein
VEEKKYAGKKGLISGFTLTALHLFSASLDRGFVS